MPDDRRLIDLLDICIERLRKGESLDQILQDYPDDAGRLRDLLQIARTAEQIHFSDHAVADAQSSVWGQLDTRKRKDRRRFRLALPLTAAAALLVLTIVSVVALQLGSFMAAGPSVIELTATSISVLNATTVAMGAATQTVERLPLSPSFMPPPSTTARPSITAQLSPAASQTVTATITTTASSTPPPTSTVIGSPAGIIVTSVEGMAGGTATPPGTTVPIVGEMTATARVIGAGPPTLEAASTITPQSLAIVPTVVQQTQQAQTQASTTPLPTQAVQLPALEPLNAGSIDDNANYDDYLLYRRNFLQQYPSFSYDVDVTMRQIITVTDSDGFPVPNAIVRLFANDNLVWQATTYADGRTLFFPNANAEARQSTVFEGIVTYNNDAEAFTLDLRDGPNWTITFSTSTTVRQTPKLDVLFLIDSTGSMADEIYELQTNVLRISERIDELNADTAYSYVTYRDAGDAYELQMFDFTPDVAMFQIDLSRLRADGGGDYPESLNQGFDTAINHMSWREDSIRLVFLIADAAPHFRDQFRYDVTALEALNKGIKVYPLASSGLDQIGEYVFRQISQLTFGRFLFLTYEDSNPQQPGVQPGEPGDDRPDLEAGENPADFTVEQLDELILRLIEEQIQALRTPITQQ